MERWMDGRNEAAARSILRSTICIQRGGILLMSVISHSYNTCTVFSASVQYKIDEKEKANAKE